ncbi:serine/arginine repetitive matrix protein 1-like isoform X2 [Pollicipes pollicipes]|uniref:serine/arginine repetitive matrix protein 1-like isoform X2 n=1 Tax=Pollicipes pollicipes TaxID=41117 RepID=UPI001884C141|nr:serine/arginine repetitive matrix protein 1-like isoform X2 [Pollicipes pollicipes]XP_037078879.1 serine/arginine repetitive matrix protein 1-like isoform X2 [Pollicipes pollicipes]
MVGRRMSPPGRDMRPIPPARGEHYPPAYPDRERMKRDFRKPSPDMHRRSRSVSPPPKKRHPPSPGYRGGGSPPMRRRRSFTPPPPMRRSRSRSPRKQRASSPRGSHRVASDARRSLDGHPDDFFGPWGTRIAVHDLKKITVDIKRNLPKGKRSSSPIIRRIINADDIVLYRRTGEGSRPLLDRPELRSAINRRFDDAAPGPNEPRVVAIIREPGQATGDRREGSSFDRPSRSRERGFEPPMDNQPAAPVGDRIERDRSERTQREPSGKDDRKLVDRSVRDRLGPKRPRDDYVEDHRLPDFSQRPNKPPIWGEDPPMRRDYYSHENRDNGYRGRGRGTFRPRGRARGRGHMSPMSWQHDKYEAY